MGRGDCNGEGVMDCVSGAGVDAGVIIGKVADAEVLGTG